METLSKKFGPYTIFSNPLREDGYEMLDEGIEENEYAVQYQRVTLESKSAKISFALKTLFYKDGYDAFGPDSFFFHSHQFMNEEDDTDIKNMIASEFATERFRSKVY